MGSNQGFAGRRHSAPYQSGPVGSSLPRQPPGVAGWLRAPARHGGGSAGGISAWQEAGWGGEQRGNFVTVITAIYHALILCRRLRAFSLVTRPSRQAHEIRSTRLLFPSSVPPAANAYPLSPALCLSFLICRVEIKTVTCTVPRT